jgi:hypothetical protein
MQNSKNSLLSHLPKWWWCSLQKVVFRHPCTTLPYQPTTYQGKPIRANASAFVGSLRTYLGRERLGRHTLSAKLSWSNLLCICHPKLICPLPRGSVCGSCLFHEGLPSVDWWPWGGAPVARIGPLWWGTPFLPKWRHLDP